MAQHLDASHEDQSRITPLFHPYCHSALADLCGRHITLHILEIQARRHDLQLHGRSQTGYGQCLHRLCRHAPALDYGILRSLVMDLHPPYAQNIPCFAHQSENAASQFHIRTIRRPYLFGHTGRGRTFHHEYRQRLFQ